MSSVAFLDMNGPQIGYGTIEVMHDPFVTSRSVRYNASMIGPPPKALYAIAERLVTYGGDEVVWAGGLVPALQAILATRLEIVDGPAQHTVEGEPSGCHRNAAVNAVTEGWQIGTGWALSDDGLWRSHSWNVVDGQICETTMSRSAYAGITLTEMERTLFVLEEIDPFDYTTSPDGWLRDIALLSTHLRASSALSTDSAWQAFVTE